MCLEALAAGFGATRGASLLARGYAGGSFVNNVVVEVRALLPGGALAPDVLAR